MVRRFGAHRRVSAGVIVWLALTGAPGRPRAAEPERTREQREAMARTACAAGRVDEGIEILAQLLTAYRHPNYIYNQARCYQENGRPGPALTRFREYLRAAPDAPAQERERAERYIDELQAELERRPDVTPVQPAPQPPRDPSTDVQAATVPSPPAVKSSSAPLRKAALALGAVALVGGAIGVASGFQVRSLSRDIEQAGPGELTKTKLNEQASKAHRFEALQWAGYGLGAAGLIGAVTCLAIGANGERTERTATGFNGTIGILSATGLRGLFVNGAF